ncbi:MAG TPA: RNA methyltransferase [Fibrobacteria bacterium]|nr:RNA methyltransferase [Fibrobacteria bacterium]
MNSALCVVLAGPEQAANVGFVARTMACYRLTDLRIVGSPGIAADGAARKTGKAVPEVLDGARYFPSLSDAIADCGQVFGFTRRSRDPSQRIEDLDPAARAWRCNGPGGVSALVFGRESQGLFREETLLLTHLVRIPLLSETLSLNVSHALAIGLHAFLGGGESVPGTEADSPGTQAGASGAEPEPARKGYPTRAEAAQALDGMLAALDAAGFFKGGKQEAQKEYVRLLWQRMNPDRREFDFLSGLLRSLRIS